MKNPDVARRHDRILSLLATHGAVSAAMLADLLGVTVQTVRADLRALEDGGTIRRRHGAAHLVTPGALPALAVVAPDEAARIGAAVARIIPPGASVALGSGPTVEAAARALSRHAGLSVFTNNIHAVLALHLAPQVTVSLAGGRVRLRDLDFTGSDSVEFFAHVRADFAVLSVAGLSPAGDLLDVTMDEIRARRAIFDCARHRILVLDQSRIGHSAPCAHDKIWAADTVICGRDLPDVARQGLARAGRRCVVV